MNQLSEHQVSSSSTWKTG